MAYSRGTFKNEIKNRMSKFNNFKPNKITSSSLEIDVIKYFTLDY